MHSPSTHPTRIRQLTQGQPNQQPPVPVHVLPSVRFACAVLRHGLGGRSDGPFHTPTRFYTHTEPLFRTASSCPLLPYSCTLLYTCRAPIPGLIRASLVLESHSTRPKPPPHMPSLILCGVVPHGTHHWASRTTHARLTGPHQHASLVHKARLPQSTSPGPQDMNQCLPHGTLAPVRPVGHVQEFQDSPPRSTLGWRLLGIGRWLSFPGMKPVRIQKSWITWGCGGVPCRRHWTTSWALASR